MEANGFWEEEEERRRAGFRNQVICREKSLPFLLKWQIAKRTSLQEREKLRKMTRLVSLIASSEEELDMHRSAPGF